MALTKIGASLGGGADTIFVTQAGHGLTLGYPVKASGNGTYAHATADTAANAEAIGIIIESTTDTMLIALSGRITVDGVVPNLSAGTVLFLQVAAGLLAAAEPSGNTQVSKPMAVITYANSEMILLAHRGEVISTAGITLADESVDSDHYVDGSIDRVHLAADIIDGTKIDDDVINSEHYVAASIDLEHMSSESVDEDNLHISNAGSNGQFLSKQSGNAGGLTWAAAGGGDEITSVLATGTHSISSSTTLTNHNPASGPAFTFTAAATTYYMVEFHLRFGGINDGGGAKMQLVTPTNGSYRFWFLGSNATNNGTGHTTSDSGIDTVLTLVTGASGAAINSFFIKMIVYGGNGGAVTMQWAQQASSGNAVSLNSPSWMTYEPTGD